jgi:hypothetical protein
MDVNGKSSKKEFQHFDYKEHKSSCIAPGHVKKDYSKGSYKRGAYRGNRNDKNSMQENIAELGTNVYQCGTWDQGDRFTRMTEAMANYVAREYSKEMRLLVKNQKENEPK